MSVLVFSQVEKVRRRLLGSRRSEMNYLDGDVLAVDSTITFQDTTVGTGLTRGCYIAIDSELLLVRSVSGHTATVRRGVLGTNATAHADTVPVEVAPRFFRQDIVDSLRDEITSWGPDIFYVPAPISVPVTSARSYGLTLGTFNDVIDVRRSPSSSGSAWPKVRFWTLDRGADLTSFPTGVALQLGEPVGSGTLKVTYSKPFVVSTFTEATDLIVTCKLEESYLDILRYGAMWRLMSGTEVARTDAHAQGESRAAEEVPPGHRMNTSSGFKKLRDQRLAEEKMRLLRRWGMASA